MHSLLRLGLLTPEECEQALTLVRTIVHEPARTDGAFFVRTGTVAWVGRNRATGWLFERIQAFGQHYARRRGIDVENLSDPLQFAEYSRGARFDWHIDTGTPATSRRKVTISIQLNGPAEYGGGELEFVSEHRELLSQGTGNAIAFSSALGHRVTRIKCGTRRVLVGWMNGPPYR